MTYQEYLDKENEMQSKIYSPGLVKDEETVARLIMTPKHYQDGEVDATAFDQVLHGMSVLRKTDPYIFETDVLTLINEFSQNSIQSYAGYVQASVGDIRGIIKKAYRLFCVLDTASKKLKSHADIRAIRTKEIETALNMPKKVLNKYLRSEIADFFNKEGLINNSSEFTDSILKCSQFQIPSLY